MNWKCRTAAAAVVLAAFSTQPNAAPLTIDDTHVVRVDFSFGYADLSSVHTFYELRMTFMPTAGVDPGETVNVSFFNSANVSLGAAAVSPSSPGHTANLGWFDILTPIPAVIRSGPAAGGFNYFVDFYAIVSGSPGASFTFDDSYPNPLSLIFGVTNPFDPLAFPSRRIVKFADFASTSGQELRFDTQTPIPGALPLFATGLGAIGLALYRRKRRQA